MKTSTAIEHVSDTAFWVATYRAIETQREDALFRDPLAQMLIGERGKKISESMKSVSRYAYWSVILRTRIIDDYLLQYLNSGCQTVINIGAGLDTRPYRLDLPPGTRWIEIDFPHVIEMKNQRLKNEVPRCQLERIAIDLSDRTERQKLFQELNSKINSAIVLTEGVIPYLSEEMVSELAIDLKALSQVQVWISEYYAPELYSRFQSKGFKKLLNDSPFLFFPNDWFSFFKNLGWGQKEIRYLYDEGEKLNRKFPLPWFASFLRFLVSPKKLAEKLRLQAYMVFEKL